MTISLHDLDQTSNFSELEAQLTAQLAELQLLASQTEQFMGHVQKIILRMVNDLTPLMARMPKPLRMKAVSITNEAVRSLQARSARYQEQLKRMSGN